MQKEMNEIIDYIEMNIREEITLEELAKLTAYSKFYISRKFNEIVGVSLSEYILRRRLAMACGMLDTTNKKIEYISDIHGFNSSKYFSLQFKKEYGCSPSNYRMGKQYVYLYPKRNIEGGEKIMIKNTKELIERIYSCSNSQDTFLDSIAITSNVELYKQENSKVILVCIVSDGDDYQTLKQVDLDLITGRFTETNLFSTTHSKNYQMSLLKDDKIYIDFKNGVNSYRAKLLPKAPNKISVQVECREMVTNFKPDDEWKNKNYAVGDLAKDLLNVKNNFELDEIINSNSKLVLMKSFISEYALIYLDYTDNTLGLFSIYLNLETKEDQVNASFSTDNIFDKLSIEKIDDYCMLSADGEQYARAKIVSGKECVSTLMLAFENGAMGTGDWDLDQLFL